MTDHPPETVDGHADEIHDEPEVPSTETALVTRRPRRSELVQPFAADDLVANFRAYQELCKALLEDSDYQKADGGKSFKKKSAWRKLAVAFDLDVQIIRNEVDRDDAGHPVRAVAWARAIAPSGRFQDGDGYCSVDEPRFRDARGRQKLENDLRATATTRAKNRAISDLLGTGEVSAEEVDAGGGNGGSGRSATAKAPKPTAEKATTLQRGKLNALRGGLGIENERAWKTLLQILGGADLPDRLDKRDASKVIALLDAAVKSDHGAQQVLDACKAAKDEQHPGKARDAVTAALGLEAK